MLTCLERGEDFGLLRERHSEPFEAEHYSLGQFIRQPLAAHLPALLVLPSPLHCCPAGDMGPSNPRPRKRTRRSGKRERRNGRRSKGEKRGKEEQRTKMAPHSLTFKTQSVISTPPPTSLVGPGVAPSVFTHSFSLFLLLGATPGSGARVQTRAK
jgi:hypothetical protein